MKIAFDDESHTLKQSADGSYTAYSKEYGEHYHSTKDGALKESLFKHVLPALEHTQDKEQIAILDICYGLGFNTLATVLEIQKHTPHKKLRICSPELDEALVRSLENFSYPEEFASLEELVTTLSKEHYYKDEQLEIELFLGDAREYVRRFENSFDIVYQDAFSPSANPMLWTQEYFADIKRAMKEDGIITTYSTALKTRLALYKNGFDIYLNEGEGFRNATIATLQKKSDYKAVDMEHKIACNPDVEPLQDSRVRANNC